MAGSPGALGDAGITLPETWDLAGIFQLVMQVLGVSFEHIMGRVSQVLGIDIMGVWGRIQEIIGVYQDEGLAGLARYGLTQLIGEENVAALMQVVEIVQMAMEGNLAALWEMVQGYLGELKDLIFGQITEFLVERVIKAGVTWIISLLNPAGAFIRACKAIYDIVMFFVERGSQIMSLVNAIVGALSSVVSGNIGAMATAVENALARAIPVAISFLASLLGLGGISDKVREVVEGCAAWSTGRWTRCSTAGRCRWSPASFAKSCRVFPGLWSAAWAPFRARLVLGRRLLTGPGAKRVARQPQRNRQSWPPVRRRFSPLRRPTTMAAAWTKRKHSRWPRRSSSSIRFLRALHRLKVRRHGGTSIRCSVRAMAALADGPPVWAVKRRRRLTQRSPGVNQTIPRIDWGAQAGRQGTLQRSNAVKNGRRCRR